MTTREYGIRAIRDEAEALLDLIPKMDDQFDKAVDLMLNCKGKVIVTGVGKSGHIGAKIAATLASTGTPSLYLAFSSASSASVFVLRFFSTSR